jgi:hypothetical protein
VVGEHAGVVGGGVLDVLALAVLALHLGHGGTSFLWRGGVSAPVWVGG